MYVYIYIYVTYSSIHACLSDRCLVLCFAFGAYFDPYLTTGEAYIWENPGATIAIVCTLGPKNMRDGGKGDDELLFEMVLGV